jgi:hypothetical protein
MVRLASRALVLGGRVGQAVERADFRTSSSGEEVPVDANGALVELQV